MGHMKARHYGFLIAHNSEKECGNCGQWEIDDQNRSNEMTTYNIL